MMLTECKVDINAARKDDGATPLHEAAIRGYGKIVKILLEHDATICVETRGGATPISLAKGYARDILMEYENDLIITGKIQQYFNFIRSTVEVMRLIHKGVDVNLLSENTMLRKCAMLIKDCAWKDLALLVSKYNSVPKREDIYEMTPLHTLCQWNRFLFNPHDTIADRCKSAELFLQKGFSPNDIFANLVTPQKFVKPQVRTFKTPLHLAIQSQLTPMAQLLVNYGASYEHVVTTEDEKEIYMSVWQICTGDKGLLDILGGKWTPTNHHRHPACIRDAIKCILLCNKRQTCSLDNVTLYKIFDLLAYKWQL